MGTTTAALQHAVDSAVGPPHKLLYGIDEAGPMIGVRRSKIYELIASGDLESVKLGKRRLIPADSLAALVARLRAGEVIG